MKSFEEWWNGRGEQPYSTEYLTAKVAYAVGLERAAVIADVYAEAWGWQIASDIRGR